MKRWWWAISIALIALLVVAIWQWRIHAADESSARIDPPAPVTVGESEPKISFASAPEFYRDIKPILDQRCVVCHGCYDAPCQLKLDSAEGLLRGATRVPVYDSRRVVAAEPTRLFVDAHSVQAWREKNFFSVLTEDEPGAENNLRRGDSSSSVLYRMLALKADHPLPDGALPASVDTSLDRKAFCPNRDNFDQYAKERPLHGMPYGLPALSDDEFAKMAHWLEAGAEIAALPPISTFAQKASGDWERFLNRNDLKSQLMARYLYEHLFLADLYFSDNDAREFFKLVRSRTPPGDAIDVIATRRPFDDPQVERVYYRLQPYRATIVAKTHLPYALNAQRMQRWQQLFLQSDYAVNELPSYEVDVAANPFIAFAAIPVQARYRFLLDDADYFIATFIKGPVCRGQLALNVVDDQFWVMFANPDIEAMVDGDFLSRESRHLRLPSEIENQPLGFTKWKKYADLQAKYLAAKEAYLSQKFPSPQAVTLDLIWNGENSIQGSQKNPSAALTVFRHFDSASVVQGFVEPLPKTAWVIDYPMLERIYYLLAAGFDVYGDASHQLMTRLYMDFLRMEGETNFLNFLPKAAREKTRNGWYQGVGAKFRDSVYRKVGAYQRESGIHYRSKNSQREFFDLLSARLGSALTHRYDLEASTLTPVLQKSLQKIARLRGAAVAYLPETVLLRVVIRNEPDRIFTLIHNNDHSNVAVLLFEQARRRPERDSVSVVPGIVGAYPNAFWVVHEDDLPQLARDLAKVRTSAGYRAIAARYAVARNGARFWQEGDWVLNTYRNLEPIEWGILDYSRYER
ncbi:MAG: fatty acid cis/trans isomerase [Spongiibacteraceae bacterium]